MGISTPLISVIIPTFNRCASLSDVLDRLAGQSQPASTYEVIVVDDGSTDRTPAISAKLVPYTLRYIRQDRQGSAAARNTGAAQSNGPILVFIDDDILVESDYLRGLLEEHQRFPAIISMGTMYPYVDERSGPFARYVRRKTLAPERGRFVHFTACTSNNLSIDRESFYHIGCWQDVCGDGQTLWGDVEFGYRAHRAGLRFRQSATAVCYHRDYAIQDLHTQSQRMYYSARLAHALFRLHPELEAALPMFRDMAPPQAGTDPLPLIVRKVLRRLTAVKPVLAAEETIVTWLERLQPTSPLLHTFYRWIIGAYIYRGYNDGRLTISPLPVLPASTARSGGESAG